MTFRTGQLGAEATVAGGVARIVTGPPELGQAIEFFEDASGPARSGAPRVPQGFRSESCFRGDYSRARGGA